MLEPTPSPGHAAPFRGPGRFSAGDAIGTTFRLALRHAGPFLLVTLLTLSPALAVDAAQSAAVERAQLNLLLWSVARAFAVAAIVSGTLQALLGGRPGVRRMLREGLTRGLRVLVAGMLSGLVTAVGLMALVVPGLIAAAGFFACEPAVVAEPNTTARESLPRSWALTRGHRWGVLGVWLLFVVLLGTGIPMGVAELAGAFTDEGMRPRMALWVDLLQAVMTGLGAVAAAVTYHALRSAREGPAPTRLAEVFE